MKGAGGRVLGWGGASASRVPHAAVADGLEEPAAADAAAVAAGAAGGVTAPPERDAVGRGRGALLPLTQIVLLQGGGQSE